MADEKLKKSKLIFNIILTAIVGSALTIFAVLFLQTYTSGLISKHLKLFTALAVTFSIGLTILSLIFLGLNKQITYKSILTLLILTLMFAALFYFLKKSGFLDKINTASDLQNYIAGYGSFGRIVFILIQFLQVTIIPIPGIITIAAGVACFGPWLGGLLSFIGIMLGSIAAFFVGRKLGFKAAKWLVGEDELNKWLKKIKGKDRVILTFMFLFPFFPDDVLCFVAGLSSMNTGYFIIMITVTRIISIFTTSLAVYGKLIPYNTVWGIATWAVILVVGIILFKYIYKNGDKIQKKLLKFKKKK